MIFHFGSKSVKIRALKDGSLLASSPDCKLTLRQYVPMSEEILASLYAHRAEMLAPLEKREESIRFLNRPEPDEFDSPFSKRDFQPTRQSYQEVA